MKKQVLVAAGVCLVQTFALAQVTTVRGVVSDATTGEPVIGANIVVKGHSGVGAVTDLSGKFVLNAPKGAKELLVSYIGYKSLTMPIKSNLVIKLEPDNSLLDDVVVTAVGITRTQKSLGYSTQKVSAKDLSSPIMIMMSVGELSSMVSLISLGMRGIRLIPIMVRLPCGQLLRKTICLSSSVQA